MKAINEFRQDKSDFIMWFSLYAMISFLAVCILFATYIYCSFNSVASIVQDIDGNYNTQKAGR